ncbi:MAG: hypothetical protein FE048_05685 [Thermoplasmata archaeon]|nr:MAG: hypothetical protein FE048_05685 [Thermoplasmata archaeon]
MRIYIGSFDDDEAEKVVEDLRKAGIKTELRHALNIDMKGSYYIQGRINELREKYKDKKVINMINKWENYVNKAREILRDGIDAKEFEEKFLDEVFPERKEDEKYKKVIKEMIVGEEDEKKIDKIIEEIGRDKFDEIVDEIFDELQLISRLHSILKENGIRYENGKMYGNLHENPFVKIYVEATDEEEGLDYEYRVIIGKSVDVYANLVDIMYETKSLEKLSQENPLYSRLLFAADAMAMMLDKIEGKIDIDEFIEKIKILKQNGNEIRITKPAINEILKALEKAEIVKIKKGKIIPKVKRRR